MTDFIELLSWLPSDIAVAKSGIYRHRLISENIAHRAAAIQELREFVRLAHEDVRQHLRSLVHGSLDPLAQWSTPPALDFAEGYPERLHMQTLMGYLGEIFAAIIAQWMKPFGEDGWYVPAFLFRHHLAAFHELEIMRQTGRAAKQIIGRHGDDSLAFKLDGDGWISHILYCESKCLASNNAGKIADAHEKVSRGSVVDLIQLIDVLRDRDDPEAKMWIPRLRRILLQDVSRAVERLDMVSYICGNAPIRGPEKSWIPRGRPHEKYTAARRFEAVEAHIADVNRLVEEVYRKEESHGVAH